MWNSEKIVSTLALIISLVTLVTLMYQSKLMREHQEKSSFPKLETWSNTSNTRYQFEIKNTGLGPAIIEDIKIVYEDSTYDIGPRNFALAYLDSIPGYKFSTTSITPGRIIEPGSKVWPINIQLDTLIWEHPIAKLFRSQKARVIIRYSSVYEKHWEIQGIGRVPVLLDNDPKVIEGLLGD